MVIDYSIPALLFPAITLLFLAYTNRFLAIATLIRSLRERHKKDSNRFRIEKQIVNLRRRLYLIKYMQIFGILSFLFCVVTMILIFTSRGMLANYFFGISLVLLVFSLGFSLYETQISTKALNLELQDMESDA
ncbi:MAG: DUF2721 domain-containing protein [Cytophagales bacterium]